MLSISRAKKAISSMHSALWLFQNDFLLALPIIFLCLCSILILSYGVIYGKIWTNQTHGLAATHSLSVALTQDAGAEHERSSERSSERNSEQRLIAPVLLQNTTRLGSLSLVLTLLILWNQPIQKGVFASQTFIQDWVSFFFQSLVLMGSVATLLMSSKYFRQQNFNAFETSIFILFSTFGLLLLVQAYSFLSLYLTLELVSLCFYALAASKRESEFATEAGVKYFLLGALSSGILLFGTSFLYGATGLTQFSDFALLFFVEAESSVASTDASPALAILGFVFVGVGLLFKLTAAPFHLWAPDVYEGAPTNVTAFFSIVPKISILGVLLRLLSCFSLSGETHSGDLLALGQTLGQGFSSVGASFVSLLLLSSGASLLVGAFGALSQRKIKRLLAYSSIGHMGYILLGISTGSLEGIQSGILYLVVYTLMVTASFAILLSLSQRSPSRRAFAAAPGLAASDEVSGGGLTAGLYPRTASRVRYVSDFQALGKSNPALSFSFAIILFSLAGIPPIAGFLSKLYVFYAAISSGFYFFAFIGVFATCVSCFYYLRIVKTVYFPVVRKPVRITSQIDTPKAGIISICVFFLLFFFFHPTPVFLMAYTMALNLGA